MAQHSIPLTRNRSANKRMAAVVTFNFVGCEFASSNSLCASKCCSPVTSRTKLRALQYIIICYTYKMSQIAHYLRMLSTRAWGRGGIIEANELVLALSTLKSMLLLVFGGAEWSGGFEASRLAPLPPSPDDPVAACVL